MSAAVAQGVAATRLPSAEFGELVRSLAGTFVRAQKQLALRQEQLLSVLRAGQSPGTLHVKLPGGKTLDLSPLDLCTKSRGYLQDMVLDLRCRVEEVETHGGQRLALRLLPETGRSPDTRALRLCFAEGNPIKAELQFGGEFVRALSLSDEELPSQESSTRTQKASFFLLDEADANWAAKHVVRPRPPSDVIEPVVIEAEPEQATSPPSALADAQVSQAPPSIATPIANAPVAFVPVPRSATAAHRRRTVLRGAALGLVVLVMCAVGLGIKYAPRLFPKPRPVEPVQAPSGDRPHILFVPANQPDGIEPQPAGEPFPTVTAKTVPSPAIRVRFYAATKDGVRTISCEGKAVPLTASGASRRLEARVVLQPGESCTATGDGKDRHYSYREFLSESASATGERSRHVRFRKK